MLEMYLAHIYLKKVPRWNGCLDLGVSYLKELNKESCSRFEMREFVLKDFFDHRKKTVVEPKLLKFLFSTVDASRRLNHFDETRKNVLPEKGLKKAFKYFKDYARVRT